MCVRLRLCEKSNIKCERKENRYAPSMQSLCKRIHYRSKRQIETKKNANARIQTDSHTDKLSRENKAATTITNPIEMDGVQKRRTKPLASCIYAYGYDIQHLKK